MASDHLAIRIFFIPTRRTPAARQRLHAAGTEHETLANPTCVAFFGQ